MRHQITQEQLDRVMKPYWDSKFKDGVLGKFRNDSDEIDWYGIYKNNPSGEKDTLVGTPSIDGSGPWFCDGDNFYNGWELFNITPEDFFEAMKRYVEKKFGVNTIERII